MEFKVGDLVKISKLDEDIHSKAWLSYVENFIPYSLICEVIKLDIGTKYDLLLKIVESDNSKAVGIEFWISSTEVMHAQKTEESIIDVKIEEVKEPTLQQHPLIMQFQKVFDDVFLKGGD